MYTKAADKNNTKRKKRLHGIYYSISYSKLTKQEIFRLYLKRRENSEDDKMLLVLDGWHLMFEQNSSSGCGPSFQRPPLFVECRVIQSVYLLPVKQRSFSFLSKVSHFTQITLPNEKIFISKHTSHSRLHLIQDCFLISIPDIRPCLDVHEDKFPANCSV